MTVHYLVVIRDSKMPANLPNFHPADRIVEESENAEV